MRACVRACVCVCVCVCVSVPLFFRLSDRIKFGMHYADRSGNGSYLNNCTPTNQAGNFRGYNNQKSEKCHELSRKSIHFLTPTPPRGGGVIVVTISKSIRIKC